MECKYSTDLLPFFCGNADPFMECVCAAVFFFNDSSAAAACLVPLLAARA